MSAIAQLMLASTRSPPSAWGWERQTFFSDFLGVSANGLKLIAKQTGANTIYASTDGGDTWVDRTPTLPANCGFYAVGISGDGSRMVVAFGAANNYGVGGIFYSTNDGQTWTRVNLADRCLWVSGVALSQNGQIVVVTSIYGYSVTLGAYCYGAISVSTNGGTSFDVVQEGAAGAIRSWCKPRLSAAGQYGIVCLDANNNRDGIGNIYRTANCFTDVTNIQGNISATYATRSAAISGNGQRIIAGLNVSVNYVRYSENNGDAFSSLTIAVAGNWVVDISADGHVLAIATVAAAWQRIRISINKGVNWMEQVDMIQNYGCKDIRLSSSGRKIGFANSNAYGGGVAFWIGTATN